MSRISTHVLDTARGRPAAGVTVILEAAGPGGAWSERGRGVTDADGRLHDLLPRRHPGTGGLPTPVRHRRIPRRARPGHVLPRSVGAGADRRRRTATTSRCCSARSATQPIAGASGHGIADVHQNA